MKRRRTTKRSEYGGRHAVRVIVKLLLLILLWAVWPLTATAQQFVYEPLNPAFGGNPVNFQWLMNSAEIQKPARREDEVDRFRRDPLQDFGQNLQRQILSQLSRELVRERFGELDLNREGRFDLGDFVIEITPGLDAIHIDVTDQLSGERTQIEIPKF